MNVEQMQQSELIKSLHIMQQSELIEHSKIS